MSGTGRPATCLCGTCYYCKKRVWDKIHRENAKLGVAKTRPPRSCFCGACVKCKRGERRRQYHRNLHTPLAKAQRTLKRKVLQREARMLLRLRQFFTVWPKVSNTELLERLRKAAPDDWEVEPEHRSIEYGASWMSQTVGWQIYKDRSEAA